MTVDHLSGRRGRETQQAQAMRLAEERGEQVPSARKISAEVSGEVLLGSTGAGLEERLSGDGVSRRDDGPVHSDGPVRAHR